MIRYSLMAGAAVASTLFSTSAFAERGGGVTLVESQPGMVGLPRAFGGGAQMNALQLGLQGCMASGPKKFFHGMKSPIRTLKGIFKKKQSLKEPPPPVDFTAKPCVGHDSGKKITGQEIDIMLLPPQTKKRGDASVLGGVLANIPPPTELPPPADDGSDNPFKEMLNAPLDKDVIAAATPKKRECSGIKFNAGQRGAISLLGLTQKTPRVTAITRTGILRDAEGQARRDENGKYMMGPVTQKIPNTFEAQALAHEQITAEIGAFRARGQVSSVYDRPALRPFRDQALRDLLKEVKPAVAPNEPTKMGLKGKPQTESDCGLMSLIHFWEKRAKPASGK